MEDQVLCADARRCASIRWGSGSSQAGQDSGWMRMRGGITVRFEALMALAPAERHNGIDPVMCSMGISTVQPFA